MRRAQAFPVQIWRFLRRTDWQLIPVVAAILLFGLVMQWSVAGAREIPSGHVTRMAASILAGMIAAFFPARFWKWCSWPAYIGCVFFLIYVLVAGNSTNHARRWIQLGGSFKIQPSEFVKVSLILVLAKWFADHPRPRSLTDLLKPGVLIAIPAALILVEPDLGTALTTAPLFLAMVWLAGTPWKTLRWLFILPALLAPFAFLSIEDYQRERIHTWWNQDHLTEEEIADAGFHLWHAKLAIGSGGLQGFGWGKGPENQLDRLPERHNDFIFPVIAEEFGLLGSIGFLLLYSMLPIVALIRAMRYRDTFTRLVVAGVGVHFAVHLCINVGVSSGVWPTTGLPLPMISWGGSSMAVSGLAIGMALAIGATPTPLFHNRAFEG
jgi:rod shape determining protein RodA